jgi:hypothetical protein
MEETMEYLILAMETDAAFEARDDPERAADYWASWTGYIDALTASGVLTSAAGLRPPWTATTVRRGDGAAVVQDGPFADSKEQLGGFFVIEVPDLDAALKWAALCPALADGSVEVRPVLPPPQR